MLGEVNQTQDTCLAKGWLVYLLFCYTMLTIVYTSVTTDLLWLQRINLLFGFIFQSDISLVVAWYLTQIFYECDSTRTIMIATLHHYTFCLRHTRLWSIINRFVFKVSVLRCFEGGIEQLGVLALTCFGDKVHMFSCLIENGSYQ